MNINDLDAAVVLRNHRRRAIDLQKAALCGSLDFEIAYDGAYIDPFSVLPADPIRTAIAHECAAYIREKEAELADLGVTVDARGEEP